MHRMNRHSTGQYDEVWWHRGGLMFAAAANKDDGNSSRDVVPGVFSTDQRRNPCHKPGQGKSAHCAIFGPTAWQYEAFKFLCRRALSRSSDPSMWGIVQRLIRTVVKGNARCTAQLTATIDAGSVQQSRARSGVVSTTVIQ